MIANMQDSTISGVSGSVALVLALASTALNAVFAFSLNGSTPGIQLLAFVAFAVNIFAMACLIFFLSTYLTKLKTDTMRWSRALCWRFIFMGTIVSTTALAVSLVVLIWGITRLSDLPKLSNGMSVETILIVWFGLCGAATACEGLAYWNFSVWTKKVLYQPPANDLGLDFGVQSPEMSQDRPQSATTRQSFSSTVPTLISPPRTPTTNAFKLSPLRLSTTSKTPASSSRTKLISRGSLKRFSTQLFRQIHA